jgi:hypothetical protein
MIEPAVYAALLNTEESNTKLHWSLFTFGDMKDTPLQLCVQGK